MQVWCVEIGLQQERIVTFFRVHGDTHGGYTTLCNGICKFLLLTRVITDVGVNGENEVLLMPAAFKHGGVILETAFCQ